MAVLAIWKITLTAISWSLWLVFIQGFITGTRKDVSQATLPSKFTFHKIQDGDGAIWHRDWKWHPVNRVSLPSNFITEKSKMAAAAIFKIGFMVYISVAMVYLCTNFFTGTKKRCYYFCRQNSLPAKSKMAVAAILKFTLSATTRSLVLIFAQNLAQRLKTTSQKQI